MKIQKVTVHNFRSIIHQTIECKDFTLFVGENNSGKTNLISVLRAFYEVDGYKFDDKTDFPKLSKTKDSESWIEIEFVTSDEEQGALKEEYQRKDNILKVRRYFKAKERFNKDNSNIFFVAQDGSISENNFYGAKNVSQAKLGKVIYIPEVAKTDDTFKLSGPSPLRQVITFVFKKVLEKSSSFTELSKAFDSFNSEFKTEESLEGISLDNLKNDINEELKTWQFTFGFEINPIKSDIIIKNLIEHFIEDDNLQVGKKRVDMKNIGQGLQRHLIYTMIKLASKYDDNKRVGERKEFYPDFTLILFEEPEAFLHPCQQELMNFGLKLIAKDNNQQVFCTSHSSIFVSKNINDLLQLKRIEKREGESIIYQVDEKTLKNIYLDNLEINQYFQTQISKGIPTEDIKELEKIINDKPDEIKLSEECLKFSIWLDSERSSMFFARNILICEGASEKTFIDFLINTKWTDLKEKHVYCLDALGKYNIHRYISLLSRFGLSFSVLMDSDEDKKQHKYFNQFIKDKAKNVYGFKRDLETFLEIKPCPPSRNDLKPLNVLKSYDDGLIPELKINELRIIINNLIN